MWPFDELGEKLSNALPQTPAERAFNESMIGNAPTLVTVPEQSLFDKAGTKLSNLWAEAELMITPESYGESLVNQIYGVDANGNALTPPSITPAYNAADLSLPAVAVKAKNAVSHAIDSVQNTFIKYGIIAIGVLVAAAILYALAAGFGKGFGSKLAS